MNSYLERSLELGRLLLARMSVNKGGKASPPVPVAANAMFSRSLLTNLKREKLLLETFDLQMYVTLNEPRVAGQIAFEYGTLINAIPHWSGLKVLDVGSGRSSLPHWLAAEGAEVRSLEYPSPVEIPNRSTFSRINSLLRPRAGIPVVEVPGDMRDIPLESSSFDCTMCLSVLEHLDTNIQTREYVPYEKQVEDLRVTIDEMLRVTKPGGYIYITTEVCDYRRAQSDVWRESYYFSGSEPKLSSAWPIIDVREIFYDYLKGCGCELSNDFTFDEHDIANPDHWTFRGPFFSAISVFARKPG